MATGWNFERRRAVCARFLVGVALVTTGRADGATNLNEVRHRVRLPSEDALFAARRLGEEQLIEFDPGGAVRAKPAGLARAADIVADAARGDARAAARTLRGAGLALELLKVAVLARGGTLAVSAPEDVTHETYRLVLTGEALTLERAHGGGPFEPVLEGDV